MKTWTTKSGQRLYRLFAGRNNVYLLTAGGKSLLIDTGRRHQFGALVARLGRLGVDRLDLLLLTHTHYDHAENTAAIAAHYGTKIFVHQREAAALRAGDSPLPRGSVLPTRWFMNRMRGWLQPRCAYRSAEPGIVVEARLPLAVFGFAATVLPTPGHSPGSLSLVVDDEIALVGDTLFGVLPRSVWPPFADDPQEMVKSWGRLLETTCRLFLPGHGREIGRKRLARNFAARRGTK